jgi:dihydrofolate reductase
MIKAILACDDSGGIGKNGTLPWPKNSRDLQWFKSNTQGGTVVMGSTTWQDTDMPRPLPNRKNIICSTKDLSHFPGADAVMNINGITQVLPVMSNDVIWIIGGAKLIEATLGIIDEFYLSRIPGNYKCDTFLPLLKINTLFEVAHEEVHPEVTFQILRKRKKNETISDSVRIHIS